MEQLDEACRTVVDLVDGAIACAVVELETGTILGLHDTAQSTQTLNEAVAAATIDMFRGPHIVRIEELIRTHRGIQENDNRDFHEVHISSANNFHFAKVIKDGRAVLMLVTKRSTNVGMGWAQMKSVIPDVEPLVL